MPQGSSESQHPVITISQPLPVHRPRLLLPVGQPDAGGDRVLYLLQQPQMAVACLLPLPGRLRLLY